MKPVAALRNTINYNHFINRANRSAIALERLRYHFADRKPYEPLYTALLPYLNATTALDQRGRYRCYHGFTNLDWLSWRRGLADLRHCARLGRRSLKAARSSTPLDSIGKLSLASLQYKLDHGRPELAYWEEVPLVPDVQPVLLLQGTWQQMGYQYAQQLAEVFGPWILDRMKAPKKNCRTEGGRELFDFCTGIYCYGASMGFKFSEQDVSLFWRDQNQPSFGWLGLDDHHRERLPFVPPEVTNPSELSGNAGLRYPVTIIAWPQDHPPFGTTLIAGDLSLRPWTFSLQSRIDPRFNPDEHKMSVSSQALGGAPWEVFMAESLEHSVRTTLQHSQELYHKAQALFQSENRDHWHQGQKELVEQLMESANREFQLCSTLGALAMAGGTGDDTPDHGVFTNGTLIRSATRLQVKSRRVLNNGVIESPNGDTL